MKNQITQKCFINKIDSLISLSKEIKRGTYNNAQDCTAFSKSILIWNNIKICFLDCTWGVEVVVGTKDGKKILSSIYYDTESKDLTPRENWNHKYFKLFSAILSKPEIISYN